MPFDNFLSRRPSHETDFLPAALSVIETPASPAARAVSASIGGFVAIALLWAAIGRVDIIATAQGKLQPVGNSKQIQPFDTGVVTAIHVNDGDHVSAGQPLVELNPITARAENDKLGADLVKTELDIARLEALRRRIAGQPEQLTGLPADARPEEIEATRAALRAQAAEQQAKLSALEQQVIAKTAEIAETTAGIEKLEESIPIAVHEEALRRQLKERGDGNEWAWLQSREHLVQLQHDLPAMTKHREQAAASMQALQRQIEQTRAEFERNILSDLAAAKQKAGDFAKDRDKAAERVALLTLGAPISGTVQQLAIHTLGGVVTPAQVLMILVPDSGGLLAEVHIPNKDVGFVRAGDDAEIKVEAFNFTRYGLIRGHVTDVSRDAVLETADQTRARTGRSDGGQHGDSEEAPDSAGYIAHVTLDQSEMMTEGGPIALGPGMRVTAEIKTGKRTVLSYLTSPIIRYHADSMHER